MDYSTASGLHNGKLTNGIPEQSVPPSIDRAEDMNAVYDEIIAVIQDAGLTPDEAVKTQLRAAINAKINAEASARSSADSNLQSQIDSEASTRSSADSNLQSQIDSEASTRASADSNLQGQIDDKADSDHGHSMATTASPGFTQHANLSAARTGETDKTLTAAIARSDREPVLIHGSVTSEGTITLDNGHTWDDWEQILFRYGDGTAVGIDSREVHQIFFTALVLASDSTTVFRHGLTRELSSIKLNFSNNNKGQLHIYGVGDDDHIAGIYGIHKKSA